MSEYPKSVGGKVVHSAEEEKALLAVEEPSPAPATAAELEKAAPQEEPEASKKPARGKK